MDVVLYRETGYDGAHTLELFSERLLESSHWADPRRTAGAVLANGAILDLEQYPLIGRNPVKEAG